jgi:hypothetical protein
MFRVLLVSSLAALLFIYVFMPSLWKAIIAVDDCLDAHESGKALVASRMFLTSPSDLKTIR